MQKLLENLKKSLTLIEETSQVISRESEVSNVKEFIDQCIESQSGNSLYICGNPGTGKSLTVKSIQREYLKTCKCININCMEFSNANSIFVEIYRRLKNLKSTKKKPEESLVEIEQIIIDNEKMILLVVDEIDQLVSSFSQVLYSIFEWPHIEGSRVILIGIANAIDLVQKTLPKLLKLGREPQILKFKPYNNTQIVQILNDRISSCETTKYRLLFPQDSLELCAQQVASHKGDLRKALEILRRVVDMKSTQIEEMEEDDNDEEDEEDEEYDTEMEDDEDDNQSKKKTTSEEDYIFTIDNVMDVIAEFFDNQTHQNIKKLPINSQIILISSCQVQSNLNFSSLYELYKTNCKSLKMNYLENSEFIDSLSHIIENGLIKMVNHKIESNRKITKLFSNSDLKMSLSSLRLFQNLLENIEDNDS
ncbi:hypothetical protein DLAC_08206 [Tieghemostelium lacteum]|uniref:AAA+ ATPase domain-containing protein n=1 Tax=Tieghemostelium lacteum TaxID=361077 RepID=A0A151ZBF2_TIELA|nr:hypothetical protein DLAC_08206 [Tieghemostelium lacteum]|eukprot:KYQ91269.1 hypothetical protein DLAC_08206 [Tieghemostelium lacteum]